MAANVVASYDQVTLPEVSTDLVDFTRQASRCLAEIHSVATSTLLDNSEKQEKYCKLQELRQKVRSAGSEVPTELKELRRQIRKDMQNLQEDYQTNSHWLVLTQRQSHLVETTPALGSRPRIKIDPSDLDTTFEQIILLPRGVEKIRAIQFLHREVLASGQDDTAELQRKIIEFSDSHLTLTEKIMALKQINWRDKNPDQMRELSALIDPTGKNFVRHFLSHLSTPDEVVQYAAVILKDRLFINPGKSPIDLMSEWPQVIDGQDTRARTEWTHALMKMQSKEAILDPYTKLVIRYLQNMVDPSGLIRADAIHKKTKNSVAFSKAVGVVIDTLEQFKISPRPIFAKYQIKPRDVTGPKGQTFQDLEEKMRRGYLSKDEVSFYAETLKTAVVNQWLSFNMTAFVADPSSFKDLVGDRVSCCDQFAARLAVEIKGMTDVHQQAYLIGNYLSVCSQLMAKGEFGLSFTLFAAGLDNTTTACPDAWKLALKKHQKEQAFLQNAADFSRNMKNLRRFMENRESKTLLCLPFFAVVGRDVVQYQEQLTQPRDHLREAIETEHPEIYDAAVKGLATSSGKDEDWVKGHFFADPQTLLRILSEQEGAEEVKSKVEQLLTQEIDIHLEIERRGRILSCQMASLQFYYRGETVDPNAANLFASRSDTET